jgi:sortase (surface protein transpeptidase)
MNNKNMKKIYNILMAAAIALGTFTSCEDVPMPFNNPLDYLKPDPEEEVIEPVGDGTKDNPFNVAGVLAYLNELGPDVESTKDIYVIGVVTSVKEAFSTQYGNAQFVISDTDEAPNQFTFYRGLYIGNKKYNNENDRNIEENDVVVICGKIVNYRGSTPETVQNKAYVVSINGIGEDPAPQPTSGEAKGTGTKTDPYNVAGVLNYLSGLGADVTSPNEVYIKGKVKEITEQFGTQYGNATFTMIDEGFDAVFTAYRVLYLGNKKYTEGDLLKENDEVIVCGKVVNFKGNTPETAQNTGYLYSLNGKTGGGGTPSGDGKGSVNNPYSVTEALTAINALADNGYSDAEVYVKGKVVKVTTNQANFEKYGNLNYLISEDGNEGTTITVYSGDGLKGAKFTGIDALKQGDEVIVYGKLQKFVKNDAVTPEIAKGNYLYSLNGKTEADSGNTPSPSTQGTKENPYNIADALTAINALADNGYSDAEVYVKGKVVKVTTNQANFEKYGNLNYLISEDGNEGTTITVYSGDGLKGAKFSGIDALKQGDEVIVYGKLQKYVKNDTVTPEIAKGNYLVSLNGKTE